MLAAATLFPLPLPSRASPTQDARALEDAFFGASMPSTFNRALSRLGAAITVYLKKEAEISDTPQSPQRAPTLLSYPFDPAEDGNVIYERVVNELNGYRELALKGDVENPPWDATQAIEQALSMIAALPRSMPFPKPMLLSSEVGIYWETDGMYAEIDFDGTGHIDAYGKRRGLPDVYIDRLRITDASGCTFFPTQLEAIIMGSKDAAAVA